jgi:hypothetical protein
MRKLSAKRGSQMSLCRQKHDRMLASQAILDQFWQVPVGFFNIS